MAPPKSCCDRRHVPSGGFFLRMHQLELPFLRVTAFYLIVAVSAVRSSLDEPELTNHHRARGYHRKPEITVFQGTSLPPRVTDSLPSRISGRSLTLIKLPYRLFRTKGSKLHPGQLQCLGGTCPELSACSNNDGEEGTVSEGVSDDRIEACHVPVLVDDWRRPAARSNFPEGTCPDRMKWLESTRMLPSQCARQSVPVLLTTPHAWKREYLYRPEPRAPKLWAGQLFRLHNVFVDPWGRVFNRTHRFDNGKCMDTYSTFAYPAGNPVLELDELVSMLSITQDPVYTEIIDKLPLLHVLAANMPQLQSMPVALHNRKLSRYLWRSLAGLRLSRSSAMEIKGDELLLVRNLYLPAFQPCGSAAPALWHSLRSHHLLPLHGVPLFNDHIGDKPPPPPRPILPGTSAPLGYRWKVVVAAPLAAWEDSLEFQALAVTAQAVKEQLGQVFGQDRVVVYEKMSVTESRQLFRHTLLLVAFDHALINTIFLPYVSAVLHIVLTNLPPSAAGTRPSRSLDGPAFPDGGDFIYQDLAVASGVRYFKLECNAENVTDGSNGDELMDEEGVTLGPAWERVQKAPHLDVCGEERIRVALESVEHSVLTSDAFDPDLLDRSGEGFGGKVPGTFLRTRRSVAAFYGWQQCVVGRGEWRYDPRPRLLPWDYRGFSNYCEQRHVQGGGIHGKKADDAAINYRKAVELHGKESEEAEAAKAEWKVRRSVKYVWMTDGQCGGWTSFKGKRFCDSRAGGGGDGPGQDILIVGDSLQEQFVRAIANNVLGRVPTPSVWAVDLRILDECTDWIGGRTVLSHGFCWHYHFNSEVCSNLTVHFLRNDYLHIVHTKRAFDHLPWTRMASTYNARVVVFNRGAHYCDDDSYRIGVRGALRHARNIMPNAIIIYRNTAVGHVGCANVSEPLKERQPLDIQPYNWDKFPGQNEIARTEVEAVGGIYMDVETMSRLRADGHQGLIKEMGFIDCLHYCLPGPIDGWVQLLYNILMRYADA